MKDTCAHFDESSIIFVYKYHHRNSENACLLGRDKKTHKYNHHCDIIWIIVNSLARFCTTSWNRVVQTRFLIGNLSCIYWSGKHWLYMDGVLLILCTFWDFQKTTQHRIFLLCLYQVLKFWSIDNARRIWHTFQTPYTISISCQHTNQ